MRNRPTIFAIALVAALAFSATACSDDDGGGGGNAAVTDENREFVEALKASMRDSSDDADDVQLTDDEIDCLAPRYVNILGVERIEAAGVTPGDLESSDMDFSDVGITTDDGNALFDAFGQCDVNIRERMLESFAADDEMSNAAAACMEGVFTDDNVRKLMVSGMVNGDEDMEDDPELAPLVGQMMGCAFMGMGDALGSDDGS
ncbi:MAG: hypothetical protein GX643_18690 [Acidimicrobiales bacterium]|nr:hypothetical protein [Acidimicrobiales bacterium]